MTANRTDLCSIETTDDPTTDLRSYGRRRGRKLSPRQQRLMTEVLPRVRLDLSTSAPDVSFPQIAKKRGFGGDIPQRGAGQAPLAKRPAELSQSRSFREIWLEIGFGGGEHLIWQARHNPDVCLIGCEPFEEGVVKVLTAIDEQGLGNIRLHADDARAVLRWLPPASIGRAFILFPDPWPKTRHRKRRLVNEATLALLARVMKPDAELRIATDIGDYARTMLAAFQKVPEFQWTATSADDWRRRGPDWPETRYEQKALREGRRSTYLTFRRLPAADVCENSAKSRFCG